MPSCTSERVEKLKAAVQSAAPGVCPERALIWTDYHRDKSNRAKPAAIRIAEALLVTLERKSVAIRADELIVGNFSSRRVGGSIYPELHGLPVLLDVFRFRSRPTNPLEISGRDIRRLIGIAPFWVTRFLAVKAFDKPIDTARFILDQLTSRYYLINETGGISHFAPDYEKLVRVGTEGLAAEAAERQSGEEAGSEGWNFLEGVKIAAEGLARFGERYAVLAEAMSGNEADTERRKELEGIAETCRRVPRHPAATFREALQSVFFAQIALNLESLDNAVCPGRMDQYLFPFYEADLERGVLDRAGAKELLACFFIKLCELIPVFSRLLTNFHGGMFNGQVVTVGGQDRHGADATNELSYIIIELMDELRMRQPNFHARVHSGSPRPYLDAIAAVLAGGANSPALYGDEAIIDSMTMQGYSLADARDYTAVGCVEPVCQGKSFSSTDAAIFNLPIHLELALNGGRRRGAIFRRGPRGPRRFRTMEDVKAAFEAQLGDGLDRLKRDISAIERANRIQHPTPLTSSLIDGCLEKALCSTSGGGRYNFSGIQCVAPAETGDALRAIERRFAESGPEGVSRLIAACRAGLRNGKERLRLRNALKFGNDDDAADAWTAYAVETFARLLSRRGLNTRGGPYVTGLYSVTAHEYFGRLTGALPDGHRRGESFASGLSPANGADRLGPTALLNSALKVNTRDAANGINLNLRLDPLSIRGKTGQEALRSLIEAYFGRGGMQLQINVLDRLRLLEARRDPGAYPHLLVRVSGYSAYFGDLTPAMQDEIIARSAQAAG